MRLCAFIMVGERCALACSTHPTWNICLIRGRATFWIGCLARGLNPNISRTWSTTLLCSLARERTTVIWVRIVLSAPVVGTGLTSTSTASCKLADFWWSGRLSVDSVGSLALAKTVCGILRWQGSDVDYLSGQSHPTEDVPTKFAIGDRQVDNSTSEVGRFNNRTTAGDKRLLGTPANFE